MYLYGRKFQLVTDNQPLTRIFHQSAKLPAMTSARLLRYASFLSGFDYEVKFKKGSDNTNVDCLSRVPLQLIKPYKETHQSTIIHGTRSYNVGDRVQSRYYTNSKLLWSFRTVQKVRESPLYY